MRQEKTAVMSVCIATAALQRYYDSSLFLPLHQNPCLHLFFVPNILMTDAPPFRRATLRQEEKEFALNYTVHVGRRRNLCRMNLEEARGYTGESVRDFIKLSYGEAVEKPICLPHVTVQPPSSTAVESNPVFQKIALKLRESISSPAPHEGITAQAEAELGHWLLSVPPSLLRSEEEVVNYLGMLVAIDFAHWAEVPVDGAPFPAEVGTVVHGFTGFYTLVEEVMPDKGTAPDSSVLFSEPVEGLSQAKGVLLRGSVAMMHLLRRAVEVHHIRWYDTVYLESFQGDCDAAMRAMKVCFLGCRDDGETPLLMPFTAERVALLLSLSRTMTDARTSFYKILCQCEGHLFAPSTPPSPKVPPVPNEGSNGKQQDQQQHQRAFIPQLVALHPRYRDFAVVQLGEKEIKSDAAHDASRCGREAAQFTGTDSLQWVPILKLSQLTALAIGQALPSLWRHSATAMVMVAPKPSSIAHISNFSVDATTLPSAAEKKPCVWLTERMQKILSCCKTTEEVMLFTDQQSLSICCDYQIPKTLRAAGLLTYDAHLSHLVDDGVLIAPGSTEEYMVRIATLIAAEALLVFFNSHLGQAALLGCCCGNKSLRDCQGDIAIAVTQLDYALWYVGRYIVATEARHHLCRTIMY